MQTINFSIHINAPREIVWNTMLEDSTYRLWTRVFSEGSRYVGSWDEGAEIRFLGSDEAGNPVDEGVYSRIKKNIPHEYISIEHIGMIKNGVIDTTSDEVKKWVPSFENYTFTSDETGTMVSVSVDTTDEYVEMFNGVWPKALDILKAIAEGVSQK